MEVPHVEVLIITALPEELQAVLAYTPRGQAESGWERRLDQEGFPFHVRELSYGNGKPIRLAAASSSEMGESSAATRATALIKELSPVRIAMCGLCAGKPKATFLGDVIVADRVYSYDSGKFVAGQGSKSELFRDIETYNLQKQWLMEVDDFAKKFERTWEGLQSRPPSRQSQRHWLLHAQSQYEQGKAQPPVDQQERQTRCPDWTEIVPELVGEGLIERSPGSLKLTKKGIDWIANDRIDHPDRPQHDPAFRVRIGSIASGKTVREDPELFATLTRVVRKTLGVEMEAVVIGALAHRFKKDFIVVKAVSDYADHEKDDTFREFACKASAAFLLEFLSVQASQQASTPGQEQAKAPSKAPSRKPLPKTEPIIGRKQEVQQIVEAVLKSMPSPVVVHGPLAMGKSAIARAAMGDPRVERHYGKHRFIALLEGAETVDAVSARIAQELGVTSVSDLTVGIQAELARNPTLLVLDNIDAAWQSDREATESLLQSLASTPTLALITTLRGNERPDFGSVSKLAIPVPPLTLEESRELFCSIADHVPPRHPHLSALLKEMSGVPLAVKLLAKQAEGVELKVTYRRWGNERMAMLQSGSDQSSSLAASIEFSLTSRALNESALTLLSILALLPAGMSEGDRSSLLPKSDMAIARLQKAALVEHEKRRWRLLSVIREHVRQKHPAREEDRGQTRDFYFSLAQRLGPQILKKHGREALTRLSKEIDNIEDLLLAADEKNHAAVIIETALQMSEPVRFSGRGSARPLKRALKLAEETGNTLKQAECLLALGRFHLLRRPQYGLARQYLQWALRLFKQLGEQHSEEDCLRELGHAAINEYELEQIDDAQLKQAEDYFREALALQQHFQDPIGEAYGLHGLARVMSFQNNPEEARRLFRKTLRMFRDQDDLLGEAYSLRHLGTLDENDDALRDASKTFSEVGELRNLGHCLQTRGDLALKR
ncbi:MAG TPA: AAA family ATPase, partial [Myxococcaceae bacterium]